MLCDEDVGTGVPRALKLVGYDARNIVDQGWAGKADTDWLTLVGQTEWLVLSCNKKMLLVQNERDTIIKQKVAVIFLTNGEEYSARILKLLLTKWSKLTALYETTPRPFARFLSPNGRITAKYRNYQLKAEATPSTE